MRIQNALVYTEDFRFVPKEVFTDGERFSHQSGDQKVIDAKGLYLIPGLIDIHLHGCGGYDFCDGTKEAFDAICAYQGKHGVTGVSLASMTLAADVLSSLFQKAASYPNETGAIFLGICMEGPFLNPEKKGAQKGSYLALPDERLFFSLLDSAKGKIQTLCIAPELPGAEKLIQKAKDRVFVSLAHTTADYETAKAAFQMGAKRITHLFNAMPPLLHRDPGVIGAAMDANADAELICDGVHVHPSAVRAAFRLFGEDHLIFISDSMRATGLQEGTYSLGGQDVTVKKDKATLQDGTLAGSVTDLFSCMKKAVSFGIPLESAVKMVSWNPARAVGWIEKMGSISENKLANFVLMDKNLDIKAVYIKGRPF